MHRRHKIKYCQFPMVLSHGRRTHSCLLQLSTITSYQVYHLPLWGPWLSPMPSKTTAKHRKTFGVLGVAPCHVKQTTMTQQCLPADVLFRPAGLVSQCSDRKALWCLQLDKSYRAVLDPWRQAPLFLNF